MLAMSRDDLEAMGRRARASTLERYDDRAIIATYRDAIASLER